MSNNSISEAAFVVVVVVVGVFLSFPVITLLKGKVGLARLGLLFGQFCWIPGAIRLAKPDSYWARRFYDEQKLARAQERFATKGS